MQALANMIQLYNEKYKCRGKQILFYSFILYHKYLRYISYLLVEKRTNKIQTSLKNYNLSQRKPFKSECLVFGVADTGNAKFPIEWGEG